MRTACQILMCDTWIKGRIVRRFQIWTQKCEFPASKKVHFLHMQIYANQVTIWTISISHVWNLPKTKCAKPCHIGIICGRVMPKQLNIGNSLVTLPLNKAMSLQYVGGLWTQVNGLRHSKTFWCGNKLSVNYSLLLFRFPEHVLTQFGYWSVFWWDDWTWSIYSSPENLGTDSTKFSHTL